MMMAPWVLSLWLITLLLLFLSPCCEAIAATIPHEHATSSESLHQHGHTRQSHHSNQAEHIHPGTDSPVHHADLQESDHQHCGAVDFQQVDYHAILQSGENKPTEDKKSYTILSFIPDDQFSILSKSHSQNDFYHSPDIKLRVYLKTERLRI